MANGDRNFIISGPEPYEALPENNAGEMFYENLKNAPTNHDVIIDTATGRRLSSRQLLDDSCNLAEALRKYHYTTQTTVGICSENNLEFFVPVIASFLVGTIMVPLSYSYTVDELQPCLSITRPRIIFCSKNVLSKMIDAQRNKKNSGYIEKLIVINSNTSVNGVECLNEFVERLLNGKKISWRQYRPFDGDPREYTAVVLCSSGTTGLPKGVMLTHLNIATRIIQSRDPRYLSNNKTVLALMPFYHAYGFFFGITSIFNRETSIMMERFNEDRFLRAIQDYKISVLRITPPLAILLSKSPKLKNYDISSAKDIFCAAAPLSADTEVDLKKRLNVRTIQQAYGCTEGTLALTIMDKGISRPGSCGKVITYMSCIVRNPETGEVLGPHQVGELCFKGPLVMKGYYQNPQATKDSFTSDGWLRTGDLGYYDNEEYFYIVDRLKELIKYNGFQVAPAELEAILINHPKVIDVGVVGLPDKSAGELPLAFVVKKAGAAVTAEELQEFVASKVSPQKKLRGGVIFVSSIPKNPSGKILRKELKKKLQGYRLHQRSKL